MEKRMKESVEEIMKDPSVHGVVCTDTNGVLYCGQGTLDSAHCSAVVSQLANLAASLEPNSQPLAVTLSHLPSASQSQITISSSIPTTTSAVTGHQMQAANAGSKVLIKTNGVITVAVHK